ncbi:hypothetical protein quinque_006089 [Culex quinquefasciatus]
MTTLSLLSTTILITLFHIGTSWPYHQRLIEYTTNLVRFLQAQHPGHFHLWFYHVAPSSIPEDPILQQIFTALDDKLVPRTVLNTFDSRWVHSERKPIPLVIVHVESTMLELPRWFNFTQLLLAVDSHTRVLVLTSFERAEVVLEVLLVPFQHTRTFNVVLLSVDREMYVFYDFVRKSVKVLTELPSFETFFPNPNRNLNGMRLIFLPAKIQMVSRCPSASDCFGYDMSLIEQVSDYVNASLLRLTLTCGEGQECGLEVIARLALDYLNCPFDIYADQVYFREKFENHAVRSPISINDAFLVPIGRPLNVVELFVLPFRFEVWTLLLCGLVVTKIASFFAAGGFQNDVLLLPICGFERFDLNQANRTEKGVIFSLIVFFFFMTNAYEAKFMALMTERPPAFEINTLDDILRMGLTVNAGRDKAELLPGYDFKYRFVEGANVIDDRLDGVSVYLLNDKKAKVALLRPVNWNFESNQPRYKMLDERLGLQISFYLLPVRSLIKPAFDHVQKVLYEAGVLQLWFWKMINMFYADGKPFARDIPEEGFAPTASILKFSDLLPMWIVLALGCSLSCSFSKNSPKALVIQSSRVGPTGRPAGNESEETVKPGLRLIPTPEPT